MTYTPYTKDQVVSIVAGSAIPIQVLTLYKDEEPVTQMAMRGLWQTLHVYGQCWLFAEPLDYEDDLYKCRFSSSNNWLWNAQQSFLFLLPKEQLTSILEAPVVPIEWSIEKDDEGNEYPVNVFGRASIHGDSHKGEAVTASPRVPSIMAEYRERVSEDPIDTCYEKIDLETIDDAIEALFPGLLATGLRPSMKDLPLILVKAMGLTLEQKQVSERDPDQRKMLREHAEDMARMIEKARMWYWDRDRYVTVLWTDDLCGVCAISVGIHPRIKAKSRNEAPTASFRRTARMHTANRSA